MILKTNLHLHTADDPKDNVNYTVFQIIDHAKNLGFSVLALTCHQKFAYKKEYADYASPKDILLIPGIEAKIEGKHVIVLNCNKDIENIKTFEQLKNYKNNNPQIFILATHPFVPHHKLVSLGQELIRNINLFDAIELTVFSNKIFNFNKKASAVAEKHNKPLIAVSDTHFLKDLKRGYVLIDTNQKTPEAIFEAIKKGSFENKLNPMNPLAMLEFRIKGILRKILRKPN
jgi:hypothetical protein